MSATLTPQILLKWDNIDKYQPNDFISKKDNPSRVINNFILDFIIDLNGDHRSHITQTGCGATDVTYLCSKTYRENESCINVRFISKYIEAQLSINTRVASEAFKTLGLQSPTIYMVNQNEVCVGKIRKLFNNSKTNGKEFAFMKAFPGAPLGNLFTTKTFFKLQTEDLQKVMEIFGSIAVYDLITANDDRFYRPKLNSAPENVEPFLNAGNILLELSLDSDDTRSLKNVFCIDNTSSNELKLPVKSKNSDYSQEQDDYLSKFFEAFSTFYEEDKRFTFGNLIYQGLIQEIPKNVAKETPFFNQVLMIDSLKSGIEKDYANLKSQSEMPKYLRGYLKTIASSSTDETNTILTDKMLDLMSTCLNFIKDK